MTRYRVIRDLQGGDFAMGSCFTLEQWYKQALYWCEADGNDELAEFIYRYYKECTDKQFLAFVGEIWALEFRKVRKDKKNFEPWDLIAYEDESVEDFYKNRFGE